MYFLENRLPKNFRYTKEPILCISFHIELIKTERVQNRDYNLHHLMHLSNLFNAAIKITISLIQIHSKVMVLFHSRRYIRKHHRLFLIYATLQDTPIKDCMKQQNLYEKSKVFADLKCYMYN